jgi:uncharacterized membrane protein HdeD (DUF308 family)
MFRDLSKTLIVRGVLAVGLGIASIVWPDITVGAFVILFAVFAFTNALTQGAMAFSSAKAGSVFGHLLLALLDIAAGVVALAWPGITAYALVIWVGAWAIVTGAVEVGMAFREGEAAGERALWVIAGVLSILFGGVVFAHPRAGALTLALLFGFFSLALGIAEVMLGVDARRTGKTLSSVFQPRAAA